MTFPTLVHRIPEAAVTKLAVMGPALRAGRRRGGTGNGNHLLEEILNIGFEDNPQANPPIVHKYYEVISKESRFTKNDNETDFVNARCAHRI